MDMDLERRIAAELRAELARQGKSRHWLAEQTGKPVTTVARWLRGPQSPGLNDLDAMCHALGMTVVDLLAAVERNGGYRHFVSDRAAVGAGMSAANLVGAGARSSTDRASDYGSEVRPFSQPHRRRSDRHRTGEVIPFPLHRRRIVPEPIVAAGQALG